MNFRIPIALLVCSVVSVAFAGGPEPRAMTMTKPVKVSAADAAGPVFHGTYATKETAGPDGPATDVVMLRSKDHRLSVGLFEAGPSETDIAAYAEDEFFYILEGGITLTSADGSVVAAKAGAGIAIPKGWKGHWSTQGYRKYYVTYETPKTK